MRLSESEIEEALKHHPRWKKVDQSITTTFQFRGFAEAMAFVNRVAELAEDANHHPDIDIRWNKVHLTLSTHSEEGLTALDFQLAAQFSEAGLPREL